MRKEEKWTYARVYIEINNRCNLSCSFCKESDRPKLTMDRELFERAIDQSKGLARTAVFHVLGEPLLHPELPCFIDYTHSAGMQVMISTNGTLLCSNAAETLLGDRVQTLNISLHAYTAVTNRTSYLEAVFEFVQRSLNAGQANRINLRLWNALSPECSEILDKINQHFGTVLVPPLSLSEIKREKAHFISKINGRLCLHFDTCFEWPDPEASVLSHRGFCYGLGSHFGILVDGTVIPCCLDAGGIIALGNIKEYPLCEILRCERAIRMREGFDAGIFTEDLCTRCGFAARFVRKTRFSSRTERLKVSPH